MTKVAATLIELVHRVIKYDKKLNVHLNGDDNNYPERVERIINNSATGKPAAETFKKFIIGKGFQSSELNNFIVDKESGTTLRQLLSKIGKTYSYQKGGSVHANYNANFKITSLKTVPFGHCRVGKKDDRKYHSKIGLSENWASGKVKDSDIQLVDVYNAKRNVIEDQINQAGGIKKYKGQVHFFHPDDTVYPLAHVDNVLEDADSEHQAAVFKNKSLRKGFMGKTVFVTPPLVDGDLNAPDDILSDDDLKAKRQQTSDRDAFKETLKSFMGVENVDGVLHVELEHNGDKIDEAIKAVKIESNIDDKMFAYTEKSAANNIRKAYQNIPSILIENSDGSIFGQSGAMLKEAEKFYNKQTADEREYIEHHINLLMSNFQDFPMPEGGLKIIPLINENDNKQK